MSGITEKEISAALQIVKSPEIMYNANNLAKVLDITPMGCLKILKRLEKAGILKSRQIGKSFIYRVSYENEYAHKYISLALSRESIQSSNLVRRWVTELKKVKNADIAILFGSYLNSFTTSNTLFLVFSLTRDLLLITFETVDIDTPLSLAMSLIVRLSLF